MTGYLLWRRLTQNDFNAMHGKASPYGRGGGAMHVALGVRTEDFRIDQFLRANGRTNVIIEAAAQTGGDARASLTFDGNPNRRRGEWLIRDQFTHRHPAWSAAAGFPRTFHEADPPYLLIFRVAKTFHARFTTASRLAKLGTKIVPSEMLSDAKGIRPVSAALLSVFHVPPQTLLETFEDQSKHTPPDVFDPANISDARRHVFAAVIQRLGQQAFRRKLLAVYHHQCAVTQCRTVWVLEAAHIIPYRGMKTNAVTNGLLLRADVHTLFDLGLISIEPMQLKVRVSRMLSKSQYAALDGKVPALPSDPAARPNQAALKEHYSLFHP